MYQEKTKLFCVECIFCSEWLQKKKQKQWPNNHIVIWFNVNHILITQICKRKKECSYDTLLIA